VDVVSSKYATKTISFIYKTLNAIKVIIHNISSNLMVKTISSNVMIKTISHRLDFIFQI